MNTCLNTHLLIIDPQNDFCDIPGAALPVAGANNDLIRLAGLVERLGPALKAITVTLDAHHPVDIAHPAWWQDEAGALPAPFTVISVADVRAGVWRPRDPAQQAHSLAYVEALAAGGRYPLLVWPEHCLIGSWGHNVHTRLAVALRGWARAACTQVAYVLKGTNPGTEHYSAVAAEVPDPADPDTAVNPRLLARLASAERILVAGQALSHCVAATVRDLVTQLGSEAAHRLTLLTDCTSPVGGFEAQGQAFIEELRAQGMQVARAEDIT